MAQFNWTILQLEAENNVLSKIYYRLTATNNENLVETEGNWIIDKTPMPTPFADLLEKDIIQILESDMVIDGVNQVKSNLENQLFEMNTNNKIEFPWLANTFTPES